MLRETPDSDGPEIEGKIEIFGCYKGVETSNAIDLSTWDSTMDAINSGKGLYPFHPMPIICPSMSNNITINPRVEDICDDLIAKILQDTGGYKPAEGSQELVHPIDYWVREVVSNMFEVYSNCTAPLKKPAVVILEDIDAYLHPRCQQALFIVLQDVFPCVQWIISTNSPILLHNLNKDQVYEVHNSCDGKWGVDTAPTDLWSWQYGDVVNYLFGVPPTPPKFQRQTLISEIKQLKALPKDQRDPGQLATLQQRLEKVEESLFYVDALKKERQQLQQREQELDELIQQLKQQAGNPDGKA